MKTDTDKTKVSTANDFVDISAGVNHTVGLNKDGTVAAVGCNCNDDGRCDVSDWKYIKIPTSE